MNSQHKVPNRGMANIGVAVAQPSAAAVFALVARDELTLSGATKTGSA